MFFPLSKIFGFVALPSNLVMLVGLIGAALLFTRRKRLGQGMMIASLLMLAIAGWSPLGNWLMAAPGGSFSGGARRRRAGHRRRHYHSWRRDFARGVQARAAAPRSMNPPSA